uniref:Uncharacterized protein n=1 Tax=Talaromyces marneffei PM1 TaxID=1077442 RepID=A0A093VAD1_TALMA
MKTATILPFLCVLAAAAPTLNKGPVKDVHGLQNSGAGDAGRGDFHGESTGHQSSESEDHGDMLGGLKKRQSSGSGGLGSILGDLGLGQSQGGPEGERGGDFGGPPRMSQSSGSSGGLGSLLGDLKKRQVPNPADLIEDLLAEHGGSHIRGFEGERGGPEKRQSSGSGGLGGLLGDLGGSHSEGSEGERGGFFGGPPGMSQSSGSGGGSGGLGSLLGDLKKREFPGPEGPFLHRPGPGIKKEGPHPGPKPGLDYFKKLAGEGAKKNETSDSKKSDSNNSNSNDDNDNNDSDSDDSLVNVLDGSDAAVTQNAQNLTVGALRHKRQLLKDLGGEPEFGNRNEGEDDEDESPLNILDGSTLQIDHNIQNITILRRYESHHQQQQHQGHHHESGSLATKTKRWFSALFGRRAPENAAVLRRRQTSSSTSSASAVPSTSSGHTRRPILNAADGDNTTANDNYKEDEDALINAADDSGMDISKNIENITILKHRRGSKKGDNRDDDKAVTNVLNGSELETNENANNVNVADL